MQASTLKARDGSGFGVGAVVGVLGGLIGLGGAEFRLPVLVGWFRYPLLVAIVMNLLVSLVTVVVSLAFRVQSQGVAPLLLQWPVALNILVGSLLGSYAGVHFATRVSERALAGAVAVLLVFLGLLLIGHEWLFSREPLALGAGVRVALGFLAGIVIGTVSSLLGVAGGELIIPTLVLLFGLDIKLAGSVSLIISVPTILVGIMRYRNRPVFREVLSESRFILFMALGSVLGAWIGSRLLPYAPSAALQVFLGAILLFSAVKMARSKLHAPAKSNR
ncbi:MAG: sulfite exporter TauE/SafE family protein [Roseiflexus sp.]